MQLKAVGVEEWPRTPSRPEDVQQRCVEGMKALAVINAGKLTQETAEEKKMHLFKRLNTKTCLEKKDWASKLQELTRCI